MKVQGNQVEEINHEIILVMDFGVEWDLSLRFRSEQWKCEEHGEWHPFADNAERASPAIIAECAGLTEMTSSEADRIKEIVDRLIQKPATSYLLTTPLTEHHVDLTDYTPIRHASRLRSPAMWTVAQKAVRKMYQTGIIERSASPWYHAPVIQKKSDGNGRFCIDYRNLNARSKKDAYPIPNMDGILAKLRRAKYISKVDLKNAYFQVALDEESRQYTAFVVPGSGLWQLKRMPAIRTNQCSCDLPEANRYPIRPRDGTKRVWLPG